jgi:radical SAM superfamily enzyme YgiQ (UPF0313 family)
LLISTYELGHQPLHVASPAAALRRAGHEVRCLDLAVEPWDDGALGWADAVAISVPMHTAMRLAIRAARRIKRDYPGKHVCLYGLYAPVSRELTLGRLADRVIAGEYEPALVAWFDGSPAAPDVVQLARQPFEVPWREGLPPLERYAHLAAFGSERPVGYVEASHGCAHECRHCPIPVVYEGRIRTVPKDVVLTDIDQLVAMGARHITFGDPDFLNGWRHSLDVVRGMHAAHPDVTFDVTTKVEHVLRHDAIWRRMAESGCLFVVSAFECMNDTVLRYLDKGHSAADAAAATRLLRSEGIEVRPSFMPFTPWTTLEDLCDILDFVVAHDLIGNVDPVQYSIRLLLPPGSLLLDVPEIRRFLGPYDQEMLSWTWSPADGATAGLQKELASIVETSVEGDIIETFGRVRRAVFLAAGRPAEPLALSAVGADRPRLTEAWFC